MAQFPVPLRSDRLCLTTCCLAALDSASKIYRLEILDDAGKDL